MTTSFNYTSTIKSEFISRDESHFNHGFFGENFLQYFRIAQNIRHFFPSKYPWWQNKKWIRNFWYFYRLRYINVFHRDVQIAIVVKVKFFLKTTDWEKRELENINKKLENVNGNATFPKNTAIERLISQFWGLKLFFIFSTDLAIRTLLL